MPFPRRTFLSAAPLSVAPLLPLRCEPRAQLFQHGVASGDPLSDAVILWTRLTLPASDAPAEEVTVEWTVAKDPKLRRRVASGRTRTSAERDFTVKLDVTGLEPGRTYYYQFECFGRRSPMGRTRTLPNGAAQRARLAVTSCSNYAFGFFNAYRLIAARADLDAVLHLGDYLYEYANAQFGDGTELGRVPDPDREIISLEDYRLRHAQYKSDPDLQEVHRQHPFICVWDDHESANDAWREGAENHQPLSEGEWTERRRSALQAYFEWMPIREAVMDSELRIYRRFEFGQLFDLIMLDTRLVGRDEQLADPCDQVGLSDPERQLLGEAQESWLLEQLSLSKAREAHWRLIGQQVMFGQLLNVTGNEICAFNPDQWDGYAAARARVLGALAELGLDNVVVLTGDIHSSWAIDITSNPFDPAVYDAATGAGSVAVEFVTPAVTSPGIDDPAQAAALVALLGQTHPHVRFAELNRRGYMLLDITEERIQAEWYHVTTLSEPNAEEQLGGLFLTASGSNHLSPASEPTLPPKNAAALAP